MLIFAIIIKLSSQLMRFADITGHKSLTHRLANLADSGQLPHALLLHGPSGIGKTNTARAFIQYICCTDRKDGDSCGKCAACIQNAALNNPDVHFVYPIVKKDKPAKNLSEDYIEEWKEFLTEHPFMPEQQWQLALEAGNTSPQIYVTQSVELLRQASLSSYGKGYKFFVVWLPEKLNAEAANRLLKMIEEPFEDTLFIMISNNPGEILGTIRSRLQSIEFQPLTESEIVDFAVGKGKSQEEGEYIARIARGNMNKAASLIEEGGELNEFNEIFIKVMRGAYARKMWDLKDLSDHLASFSREKASRILDYFARMIRESFISNLKCRPLQSMTPGEEKFVGNFGPFVNAANVEELLRETDRSREDIMRNANQKIVWFDYLINLTKLIRTKNALNKN